MSPRNPLILLNNGHTVNTKKKSFLKFDFISDTKLTISYTHF